MSKVEELAKKYCEGSSFSDACMERPAYIAGYHQAEKDNELTWEDIKYLDELILYVYKKENLRDDELYKETLKRFKERKENEVQNKV